MKGNREKGNKEESAFHVSFFSFLGGLRFSTLFLTDKFFRKGDACVQILKFLIAFFNFKIACLAVNI